MVGRVAWLCLLEGIVTALLGWQVFAGSREERPAEQPTRVAELAPDAARAGPPVEQPAPPPPDPTTIEREAVAPKYSPDDPVGVLLTGTLRLGDGSPVQATVTLRRDGERRYTGAAEDGTYALLGLEPGEWQATVRDNSIVELKETVTLTDEAVQRRDFTCDGSFSVRVLIVTPDGQDATRALRLAMRGWGDFSVVGQRDPFPARFAATDYGRVFVGDARWDSEMNPEDGFAGTLYLTSVPACVALLQRHLVLQQVVVQPGQQEVKFTVDVEELRKLAASASLRVLDELTGAPLTEAHVAVNTSNRGGGGMKVDAEGRALLEGLSPGLLRCEIRAKDHEEFSTVVRVEAGQRLDLGDIRLGPVANFTGTVLMPDGAPAGANLAWTELKWRSRPAEFTHNRSTSTDAEGRFQLWNTGRGPIAVRASGEDGLIAAGVFDNPPATPVVLRLAPPGRCTIVRAPDPTRAFTVTFYDAHKRAIEAHAIEPRTTEAKVTLPCGDYTFEVHDELDRLVQTGSLRFAATPCRLEIR